MGRDSKGRFVRSISTAFGDLTAPAPLPDLAIVTLYLDRSTGEVRVDDEFSTPMETWAMLATATEQRGEQLAEANGYA